MHFLDDFSGAYAKWFGGVTVRGARGAARGRKVVLPRACGATARRNEFLAPGDSPILPPCRLLRTITLMHAGPPIPQPPRAGEIHIWRVALETAAPSRSWCESFLNAEERAKAARFHFEIDQLRSITGRGLLRWVLGQYLDLAPAGLSFELNERGKPRLPAGDLRFNLSHSGDMVLLAFTRDAEIGVDIERLDRKVQLDGLVNYVFSTREKEVFAQLPEADKRAGFFNVWTRKEAYVKGRGQGIFHELNAVTVSLVPGEPARLLTDERDPGAPGQWSLQTLEVPSGYAGAVAVEGGIQRVEYHDWPAATVPNF